MDAQRVEMCLHQSWVIEVKKMKKFNQHTGPTKLNLGCTELDIPPKKLSMLWSLKPSNMVYRVSLLCFMEKMCLIHVGLIKIKLL